MTSHTYHEKRTDPSPWIKRFICQISGNGTVLDLACGGGRHGRLFLSRGHRVTFLDCNITAITDLSNAVNAELIEADLEADSGWPFTDRTFDAVIVTNYLSCHK